MNTALKNRLKKLETSRPEKESSLTHLTNEELDEAHYLHCKAIHEKGGEIEVRSTLWNIRCREFFTDESWIRDANHRISVFQKFLRVAYKQNLPETITDVFELGCRNVSIPKEDIELTLEVFMMLI